MRGRSNTGAKAVRSQGRSPSPRLWPVPGKEAEPVVHLGMQSTLGPSERSTWHPGLQENVCPWL